MVPRILTHDKKQRRLHISSDLLRNAEMFDMVITGDETWCFQYELETKRENMQWKTQNSPRPEKARMSRSQVKNKGIVHYKFIAQGQTVNQQCYLEVLTRLRGSVLRKRPGLWPDKWILHHDKVPTHDAFRFRGFLAMNSITKNGHSTLFTWLSSLRFFGFLQNLKLPWRDKDLLTFLTSNASSKRYCEVFRKTIFKTVSGSGAIVWRSAQLHKDSSSWCSGIKQSHFVLCKPRLF